MEEKKNWPVWIRVTGGILAFLLGVSLSGIVVLLAGYAYPTHWSIFEHLWGKIIIFIGFGICGFLFLGFILAGVAGMARIFRGNENLFPHGIYPFPAELTKESASQPEMLRVDDQYLIYDFKLFGARGVLLFICGFSLIASILAFIYSPLEESYNPFSSIFLLGSLLGFLIALFNPSQRFVFNRMAGTITFPRLLFFPPRTISFSKVVPGNANGTLGFCNPYTGIVIPVYGEFGGNWWCFYVLYMDKNRPLPQGTAFDSYREKDFLRRKAAGFPKPIYPNEMTLVNDANMGYIYGTNEFKAKMNTFKRCSIYCYTRVKWYCQDHKIDFGNTNNIVLIGIWKDFYVFKLFSPENIEYILLPDDTALRDCFLCHGNTAKVKHLQ